jgi:hypothetical protein
METSGWLLLEEAQMEEGDVSATSSPLLYSAAEPDLSSDSDLDMDFDDIAEATSPSMSDTPEKTSTSAAQELNEDWLHVRTDD